MNGIIPVIVFIIPYRYELYVINNCNYLLKYNFSNEANKFLIKSDVEKLMIKDKEYARR